MILPDFPPAEVSALIALFIFVCFYHVIEKRFYTVFSMIPVSIIVIYLTSHAFFYACTLLQTVAFARQ